MTLQAPSTILQAKRLIMSIREYHLWNLTELRQDDPRAYLDMIVYNAKFDKVQAIQYQGDTVFVISKAQYEKFKSI